MGYLSCNAESAIATCDPHYWDLKKVRRNTTTKTLTTTIKSFHYTDLVSATNGFSTQSYLGKGSHGRVYKATLNDGNLTVAVKTTKLTSKSSHKKHATNCTGCGNCTSPAENEIEILSQVPSPRLVNLIGYCTDPNGNKLIVVEYMSNGSLHDLLHSSSANKPPGWTRRLRFALQVAKAVRTLHGSNPPVIHRDIKSSNVLIDDKWNARLGDFGLALRGHVEDVRVKCTPPAGTLGYLDPCYLAPGDLSAKSDVFSFGILLLEIISGRNAIDVNYSPPSVVDWAVPLIRRGDFTGICDRRIGTPSDTEVVRQLAVLAARCVRSTAEKRPAMAEVVECLKLARKRRIHVWPIWKSLRRRVESGEALEEEEEEEEEGSEEVVKVVKGGVGGSRRRRKSKVSSVPAEQYVHKPTSFSNILAVTRSKSIGSSCGVSGNKSWIQNKIENDCSRFEFDRRRRRREEKMALMRLKKSNSTGVLHYGINNQPISVVEMIAMSNKLVISDTSKSEMKMHEKPLVSTNSYSWDSE